MNPASSAPELRRFTRFAVSGATSTGVHVAITATLVTTLATSPVTANCVAFLCATACSYLLNTLWSFSSRPHCGNFVRFLSVSFLGMMLTISISWTVQRLGATYWIGLAWILLLVPPSTFALHRWWTYR
ncbi:GtrA family protein [Cupriavidus sp. UYPR2.512]|uniref:GtrA family protein n=1 Tax=Cupriavidus sp. UYPR2.512 TaxID=1080187 RepID=UPI0003A6D587|nr:GtrA family protein [Cupriavidus sp. UYPR2.512]UIF86866.1 GtrA family protein [Cupriavidus necator]